MKKSSMYTFCSDLKYEWLDDKVKNIGKKKACQKILSLSAICQFSNYQK